MRLQLRMECSPIPLFMVSFPLSCTHASRGCAFKFDITSPITRYERQILSVLPLILVTVCQCGDGVLVGDNGKCYTFDVGPKTFDDSKAACTTKGYTLVSASDTNDLEDILAGGSHSVFFRIPFPHQFLTIFQSLESTAMLG